jgi:Ser/Thr protein kinase RdoA (MazF antagonist)
VPQSVDCADAFGRILASFHAAADDFVAPAGSEWTQLSQFALMGADPRWVEKLYSHNTGEADTLVAWWHEAHAVLAAGHESDNGMCHGEAYPATCRLVGDELGIAELDWAGEGARAYDLATYRWVLEVHAAERAEELFARFLDAYAAVREVPNLAALRAWVAARHFWSMRLAAGFADPAGLSRRASFAGSWDVHVG